MNTLYIDGIAFWTPDLPGWEPARAALRSETEAVPAPNNRRRPAPTLLGPNERRRAPDSVLLALEVAQAAVTQSGQNAAALASVFTSTHGDLGIVDGLCTTLANNPMLLSPTRFHHSVHNAASGYWAIASGCRRNSSAIAHFGHAFAAGWLEAASQCAAESQPVLLVGFDTAACGALASVNRSRGLLGVALVLSPVCGAHSQWRVDWALGTTATEAAAPASRAARALADNAMADALPLFELLAAGKPSPLALPLESNLGLALRLLPVDGQRTERSGMIQAQSEPN